jgi:hypothetical protein
MLVRLARQNMTLVSGGIAPPFQFYFLAAFATMANRDGAGRAFTNDKDAVQKGIEGAPVAFTYE